jgi:hypothetical protein
MKWFTTTEDLPITFKSKWGNTSIYLKKGETYFSTTSAFNNLIFAWRSQKSNIEIIEKNIKPTHYIDITQKLNIVNNNSLNKLTHKRDIKILIINGFVSGIGDNLVGMQALAIFNDKWKSKFNKIEYHLYNENINRIKDTVDRYQVFTKYHSYPCDTSILKDYDAIIDLDDIHLWPEFNTMNMIDCFLSVMGISPITISPTDKHLKIPVMENFVKSTKDLFEGIRYNNDKKLLLIQTDSSSLIRGMTKDSLNVFLQKILDNTDYRIVTFTNTDIQDKRILNLKSFSNTLDEYFSIVACCDYVICTDTSAYHLSSSFHKPTVVLFTSILPDLRIRYYRKVKPINVMGNDIEKNPIFGMFDSSDPELIKLTQNKFKDIDIKLVLDTLHSIK